MATKIVYHETKKGTPCQDGIAAACVAWMANKDSEAIGWVYQNADRDIEDMDLPVVESGDKLIIVDFSFPKKVLDMWAENGVEITVIDHHKSAWERLQGFTRGVLSFDMARSGVGLTWKYFFPDRELPAIFAYIEDQDLWKKSLPLSEIINAAIYPQRVENNDIGCEYKGLPEKVAKSFTFFERFLNHTQEEIIEEFRSLGEKLIEERTVKVKAIARRAYRSYISGYQCMSIEFKTKDEHTLRSFVLEELYNSHPEVPVTVGRFGNLWDLRSSKKGIDCSAIAKTFGGGGHYHAAGFSV